jgi:hypothetical protein
MVIARSASPNGIGDDGSGIMPFDMLIDFGDHQSSLDITLTVSPSSAYGLASAAIAAATTGDAHRARVVGLIDYCCCSMMMVAK